MVRSTEFFPTTSRFDATLEVTLDGRDAIAEIRVRRLSGGGIRSGSTRYPWEFRASAPGWSGETIDGEFTYDLFGSGVQTRVVKRVRFRDVPAGELSIDARVTLNFVEAGSRTATPSVEIMVGGPPLAPARPTLSGATRTSLALAWATPNSNLSPITGYEVQYNTAAGAAGSTTKSVGPDARRLVLENLESNTLHYARVRAKNELGLGAWSAWSTGVKTLTAQGPTVSVMSDGTGTRAEVAITGGTPTGDVDFYVGELVYVGPQIMSPPAKRTFTAPAEGRASLDGLIPGATYQYRASARLVGGGSGPWSAYVEHTQNAPTLPLGSYFDGSFGPRNGGDLQFRFTGTEQLSTSEATAPAPLGWGEFPTGVNAQDAQGILFSLGDGRSGERAARALFTRRALHRGVRFLLDPVPVSTEGDYYARLYVRASVQKLHRGVLVWMNGSEVIGEVLGDVIADTVSPSVWYPVEASGAKPDGATHVAFGVQDTLSVNTSNPTWFAGDVLDMDDASLFFDQQYPYFDGSTPNTGEGFAYFWTSTVDASTSYREDAPIDESLVLVDPDCAPIPTPPRPPLVRLDCIEDSGLWTRYWSRIAPQYGLWVDSVPTLWIEALVAAERQVRVRWFRIEGYYAPVYGEWTTERTNLFRNPDFDGIAEATTEISRNLAQGPYPTGGTFTWGAPNEFFTVTVDEEMVSPTVGASTARAVRNGLGGFEPDYLARIVRVGGAASDNPSPSDLIPVEGGKTYTLSVEILSEYASPRYRIGVSYRTPDGVGIGFEVTRDSTTPAGEWSKQTLTTPALPASVTHLSLDIATLTADASVAPADVPMWVGEVMAQEGFEVEDYFDGNGGPDVDYVYAWAGEAGASQAIKLGAVPFDVTAYTPPTAEALGWGEGGWGEGGWGGYASFGPATASLGASGGRLRIHPIGADPQTSAILGGDSASSMNAGMLAGGTYTVLATFSQDAPQVGPVDEAFARRIRVVYNTVEGHTAATTILSEQAPNTAGLETELRLTFTLPDDAVWAQVQLGNGAAAGGGDVFYDRAAIITGAYDGGWFDGDTAPNGDTARTIWSGEPDYSTSVWEVRDRTEVWTEPPVEALDPGAFIGEQVLSYLPVGGRMVLDGVDKHARFEKANGVTVPADHLLAGSAGLPPLWPVLSCSEAYYVTIDVPTDTLEGNLAISQGMTAVIA